MPLDSVLLERIQHYESSAEIRISLSSLQVSNLVQKLRADNAEYSRKKLIPFQRFVIQHVNHILGQRKPVPDPASAPLSPDPEKLQKKRKSESLGIVGSNLLNTGLRATYSQNAAVSNPEIKSIEQLEDEDKDGAGEKAGVGAVTPESVKFNNFGAIDHLLEPIFQCIYRLRNPQSFPRQKTVSGILLHGPPGCGKTMLAHAIANEAEVPILKFAAAELSSPTAIRNIFSDVRNLARCVLLLDEVDAIALKRDSARQDVESKNLTHLMTCIDGLAHLWDASRNCAGHVIIIGTTNRPEDIDPALRRSGRLTIEIGMEAPDKNARAEILSVLTRDMPVEGPRDFSGIATRTRGFVAADLFELTQQATFIAEQRRNETLIDPNADVPWWKFVNTAGEEPSLLMEDFEKAVSRVQPSMTREGFSIRPEVPWEDVGGLTQAVEELKSCLSRCISPSEECKKLGIRTCAGFLLYGPPGCGKTLLAKAAASFAEANFISIKGPELLRRYLGDSEREVRKVFKRARECPPCVICLDEIDSLCPRRGGDGNTAVDRVVNQFLVEMDGVQQLNGVVVIATTNRKDAVDEAFLRPGRLGTHIEIPLPDEEARVSILRALTRRKALGADVDLATIGSSEKLQGFSGSHLAEFVEQACIAAVDEGVAEIWQRHCDKALAKIAASFSKKARSRKLAGDGEQRTWFGSLTDEQYC